MLASGGRFSPRLVIMAREPRAGRIKTRLAVSIGTAEALRFYRTTLARLLRQVGSDPRWETLIAVTPDSASASPLWPSPVARLPQGHGDLGGRMQRIFDRLPPGPAIIVGSDIPGIRAVAAHGHTPGHMAYLIESQGKPFLIWADTTNHYVMSLQQPDWHVQFDMDKDAAAATRRRMLDMAATDRIPATGYHMPFPAVGFVEKTGDSYRWVPVSYQLRI